MRKIILHCGLSPGDIVMLTAAVRDLHRAYPGQFETDVRTVCPEIWEHNPDITVLDDNDPGAAHIECSYPLINSANKTPYHALHGFIEFLNAKLGLDIRPTEFKGAIYLSDQEKAWYSQVKEVTGEDIPFWIIAAGGKFDITIKWWQASRYQQVVDLLRGEVQFVQMGGCGHYHPPISGAIDLRGQTNLRELIRLVYHAQGVLCSITALMHLAAAVESKKDSPANRPCVVIAGGREPVNWEHYPGHQFIHTIGALPCCANGGCWKDRANRLRDGDDRDKSENLCTNLVDDLPRCLDMIRPEDVVKRIRMYYEGGLLKYLTPGEIRAGERGIAATGNNPFDNEPLNIHSAGMACDRALARIPAEIPAWNGRGIVICGGGIRYFTNAWVCINMLRRFGCALPVEVWHLSKDEMSADMAEILNSVGAKAVNASNVRRRHPSRRLFGWELKPYSILHSQFQEVLLLDADNVPVKNPEFLFDTDEFKQTGAIFWPDFNHTSQNDQLAIWRSCGLRRPPEREFETGQILVDKARCWRALNLCMWFNENADFYYRHIHGDKETFHLAFRKARKSYHLIKRAIHPLKATMCQHDAAGQRLFQHRNLAKWDLAHNRSIKGFWFEDECLSYLGDLKSRWDGGIGDYRGPKVPSSKVARHIPKIAAVIGGKFDEVGPRRTFENLVRTDWDGALVFKGDPANNGEPDSTWASLIAKAAASSADFILLLHGELLLNRHLYHNLLSWRPLRNGRVAFASLYNPQIREAAYDFRNNARVANFRQAISSEALVLSLESARCIVKLARRIENFANLDIARIAAKLKRPVLFHAPSLVQKLQDSRDAEEEVRVAIDFDPNWRV